jgi:Uma2 family endonuclease
MPSQRAPRPEPAPHRKRWKRSECVSLVESGLLTGRYELIDGEIVPKMGQKPAHAFVIVRLTAWLIAIFGGDFVRSQLPIDVTISDNETNEPEPDAAALARPIIAYAERNPGPNDLLLVVEVSDTTLRFDLRAKAALYARAGIRKYWVVGVPGRRIVVHRNPTPRGYRELTAYAESESLAPLVRPDALVMVASLLPLVENETKS